MPDYPETPKGPLPGSTRNRRREPLPSAQQRNVPPPGTPLQPSAPAPTAAADGDLQVTRRQRLPEGKVLGLNVSESHYDRGTLIIDVLSAKYGMNKRQIGELLVMFLDTERFRLSEFVERFSERAVDLDYLSRPPQTAHHLDEEEQQPATQPADKPASE